MVPTEDLMQRQKTTQPRRLNVAETPDQYDQMLRVYRNLFKDPSDGTVSAKLREALRTFDLQLPDTQLPAAAILQDLNEGVQSPFDGPQMERLRALFVTQWPISPSQRDSTLSKQARAFWHALVGGEITDVEKLWVAIHEYDVGADGSEERLIKLLQEMVPGDWTWSEKHLEAFVTFASHDYANRRLAWWNTFHDAW